MKKLSVLFVTITTKSYKYNTVTNKNSNETNRG
jgi:hypothetical protein